MAEKLCGLRKKGGSGKMSETVLWTNSNTLTSWSGDITGLSDSIQNYDYIKVTYMASSSSADQSKIGVVIFPAVNTEGMIAVSMCVEVSSKFYSRPIRYANKTTGLDIGGCFAPRDQSPAQNYCIPYQIIGMKY